MILTTLCSYIWLVFQRKQLFEYAIQFDADVYTPSDFCLIGKNMKFDDYNPEAIKTAIKNKFKEEYEIDVIYANPVYDIADYNSVFNK